LEYEEKKRMKRLQAIQKQNLDARQLASKSSSQRSSNGGSGPSSSAAVVDRLYHRALSQKQMREETLHRNDLIERSQSAHKVCLSPPQPS
jgi:hypothetical protein